MSQTSEMPLDPWVDDPAARASIWRWAAAVAASLTYLGGAATLFVVALTTIVRRPAQLPALFRVVARQLDGVLRAGTPVIGLASLGFGAFLAMQAHFRATFAESNGAVVGLGLMRSASPQLVGLVLACILAVRAVCDLGDGLKRGLDHEPDELIDRAVATGRKPDRRPLPDLGQLALARLICGALAGPVLICWSVAVGMTAGLGLSSLNFGVTSGMYFGMFLEMLQVSDVAGVLVLGGAYGATGALLACHEGLRLAQRRDAGETISPPRDWPPALARSVVVTSFSMLVINALWFTLVYTTGPAFGVGFVTDTK